MPFTTLQQNIRTEIDILRAAQLSLNTKNEQLKIVNAQILAQTEAGVTPSSSLTNQKTSLESDISGLKTSIAGYKSALASYYADYQANYDKKAVVGNMSDTYPIVLFPVRMETRFHQYVVGSVHHYELWVRIFPDDIAVQNLEKAMLQAENDDTIAYWNTVWLETDKVKRINAANNLMIKYGQERASYLINRFRPTNFNNFNHTNTTPAFPTTPVTIKYHSWSQPAVSRVMPDAFTVSCYDTYDPANPSPSIEYTGNVIPDEVQFGYDPNMPANLQVEQTDELKWLYDFNEAIAIGLGMKIPVSATQYQNGFARVTTLGIKALLNQSLSKQYIEDLLESHHYTHGLSILKTGDSTKNAGDVTSGYSSFEFGNTLNYNVECEGPLPVANPSIVQKPNGQWLWEAFGINRSFLDHVYNSDGLDIANAIRMNNCLYSATAGYALQVMYYPAITLQDLEDTDSFFTDYVRARGALPSIRVNRIPYGILPTSVYSRYSIPNTHPKKQYYDKLKGVLDKGDAIWSNFTQAIPVAGMDTNTVFADLVGRNATSSKYYSRAGAGPAYTWNSLVYNDMTNDAQQWHLAQSAFMQTVVAQTGINVPIDSMVSGINFLPQQERLTMPVVDDNPPSKDRGLAPLQNAPVNFIQWMQNCTVRDLKEENFTNVGSPAGYKPTSLLYVLLRQALLLEYYNAACNLLGIPAASRIEKEYINMTNPPNAGDLLGGQQNVYEPGTSRWAVFEQEYPAGTGIPVGMFLDSGAITPGGEMAGVVAFKDNLNGLHNLSTFDLQLLTGEHMDVVSYRLDSWQLGMFNERLQYMRSNLNATGVYIGAYGWLENVKSATKTNYSGSLPTEFNDLTNIEVQTDNKGFVLAPSLNHAVAAAVLRSAYDAKSDSTYSKTHEINLSSERVRQAQKIYQGLKNQQPLAALLGYEFERGINQYPLLNQFILNFRDKFRLDTVTENTSTSPLETIAANNVVHGKKLLDSYRSQPTFLQFLQVNSLDTVITGSTDRTTIKTIIDTLDNIMDSITDLATAEGAYQLVNGNLETSNAITSALSGGLNPPDPTILTQPRTGTGVSNRIGLTLPVKTSSDAPANWTMALTERAKVEPSLNNWLGGLMGDPDKFKIRCQVMHEGQIPEPYTYCYKFDANSLLQTISLPQAPDGGIYIKCKARLIDTTLAYKAFFSFRNIAVYQSHVDNSSGLTLFHGDHQTNSPNPGSYNLGFVMDALKWKTYEFRITPTTIETWVDGVKNSTVLSLTTDFVTAGNFDLYFGGLPNNTNNGRFYISDIEIYDIGSSTSYNNLLAQYACNETDGYVAVDEQGVHNGVIQSSDITSFHSIGEYTEVAIKDLPYHPLDLVYFLPEQLENDDAELALAVKTIVRKNKQISASIHINIEYDQKISSGTGIKTFSEAFGMLKYARKLILASSPLKTTDWDRVTSGTTTQANIFNYGDIYDRVFALKSNILALVTNFDNHFNTHAIINFTGSWVALLRDLMQKSTEFNVKEGYPWYYNETDVGSYTSLRDSALIVREILNTRYTAAAAIFTAGIKDKNDVTLTEDDKISGTAQLIKAAKAILGDSFNILPQFALSSETKTILPAQYNVQGLPVSLLSDHAEGLLVMEEWLQGVARIRPKVADFETFAILTDSFLNNLSFNSFNLKPYQLPYIANDRWLALPVNDQNLIKGGKTCLAVTGFSTTDVNNNLIGLLIDSWEEIIPNHTEMGGLTMQYDQPNSKAPQCILLALPPSITGSWNWDDVMDSVNETFDLAKKRAVEYEQLATTKAGHLLPLTYFPLADHEATIGVSNSNFA